MRYEKPMHLNKFDIEEYKKILVKRVWNIHDVAIYTNIPVRSLYQMTHNNLIPYRKKRGRLFFIAKEVINWLEESDE